MDIKELINRIPKRVTPYSDIRIYPKGSNILVPDAKNSSLHLLLEETAKTYQYTLNGMFISLYRYGRDSCFGEVELCCGNQTTLGASATDTCRIIKLSRKGVGTRIHEDNGFYEFLLHQMALKIAENLDAYTRSSPMELKGHVLYCLYRRDRTGTLSDLTKEWLMSEVRTSIRSLNRVLAQYREEGLVAYGKHRFRIVNGERFSDAADKLVGDQR